MTQGTQTNSERKSPRRRRYISFTLAAAILISLLLCGSGAAPAQAAISISHPSDITLPAIPGTGGVSEGTVTWTVSVTALLGYTLTVNASTTPAMTQTGYAIPDFPYTIPTVWSVAANDAAFGFSAQGTDTPTDTWGTPGSGSGKYRGFSGTTPIQIASGGLVSTGGDTTAYFKGEVGSSYFAVSGTYTAVITATATSGL